jgi:aspartate carbamoyltransferase catalytic subunit
MMNNLLYRHNIVSVKNIDLQQMDLIFKTAKTMKQQSMSKSLTDKIIAHCFFEPSTRTRLSFETAAHRLGAKIIGFTSNNSLSIKKGEN